MGERVVVVGPGEAIAAPAALRMLRRAHPEKRRLSYADAIGDVKATKVLAELLERFHDANTDERGRVDWMGAAGDLMAWMKDNQR